MGLLGAIEPQRQNFFHFAKGIKSKSRTLVRYLIAAALTPCLAGPGHSLSHLARTTKSSLFGKSSFAPCR
jgi:hypothetical protein